MDVEILWFLVTVAVDNNATRLVGIINTFDDIIVVSAFFVS